MPKNGINEKGVVLLMVLGTILVVVVLAGVILSTIASQSRLTHHQVSRIQAQYAAKAGMVYALEQLRVGTWSFTPNSCPNPSGCAVVDSSFPSSVKTVKVIFCPAGSTCANSAPCNPPAGTNFCINIVADYTYTP